MRTKVKKWNISKPCYYVVGFLLLSFLVVTTNFLLLRSLSDITMPVVAVDDAPATVNAVNPRLLVELVSRPNKICSSATTLFPNSSIVDKSVMDAEKFHEGGSLKSIQQYLDRQIQKSYEILGVGYVPSNRVDQKKQAELSTPELIHEEL
jgi:hypothetical protein